MIKPEHKTEMYCGALVGRVAGKCVEERALHWRPIGLRKNPATIAYSCVVIGR